MLVASFRVRVSGNMIGIVYFRVRQGKHVRKRDIGGSISRQLNSIVFFNNVTGSRFYMKVTWVVRELRE